VVAAGHDVADLAVADAMLYWLDRDHGDVLRAPVGGGRPQRIATGSRRPRRLVIEGADVLWTTDDGDVLSAPRTGGATRTLATGLQKPWALAADPRFVYWAETNRFRISCLPRRGGAAIVVAAHENWPLALAADGDALYWLDQHLLRDGADQPDEHSGRLRTVPRRCVSRQAQRSAFQPTQRFSVLDRRARTATHAGK